MFEDFLKSSFCNSRLRCSLCRTKEGAGLKWRSSMTGFFKFDNVNFDCPFGNTWGNVKSLPSQSHIDMSTPKIEIVAASQITPPPRPVPKPQPQVRILTNTEWNGVVAKINAMGTLEDRALAQQIVDQSKTCGCKSRFAGMQYQLWEKYK